MARTILGPVPQLTVLGAGTAFPARELDNVEVLRRLALLQGRQDDPARIAFAADSLAKEQGLERRAWCHMVGEPLGAETDLAVVELGTQAAHRALVDAQIAPSQVGAMFVATSSPHRMTGTVSAAIGAELGIRAMCMDARAGCSAGLFALTTAALFIAAEVSPVLVIGTETFSKVIPPRAAEAVVALADGAGALVLGAGRGTLLGAALDTDGTLAGLVNTPGPMPPTLEAVRENLYQLSGQPEGLKEIIPRRYVSALQAASARAGIELSAIDAYIPHQVGRQVVHGVCTTLGIPVERAWVQPGRHGNVGAAGWMVALAEARNEGWLAPNRTIALASVGGGMSSAAALLRT